MREVKGVSQVQFFEKNLPHSGFVYILYIHVQDLAMRNMRVLTKARFRLLLGCAFHTSAAKMASIGQWYAPSNFKNSDIAKEM